MSDKLYLDDIKVGDIYESTEEYELTKEEIISFSKQYDPQFFHLDEEAAEKSFFKGLSGSGWLTAAITMRLTVLSFPVADGLIGAGADFNWTSPTRVGDRLKVKITITDVKYSKSKPNQGIVSYETVTTNQDGEARLILNTKMLSFRK